MECPRGQIFRGFTLYLVVILTPPVQWVYVHQTFVEGNKLWQNASPKVLLGKITILIGDFKLTGHQVWWCMSIIAAAQEAEAGSLL